MNDQHGSGALRDGDIASHDRKLGLPRIDGGRSGGRTIAAQNAHPGDIDALVQLLDGFGDGNVRSTRSGERDNPEILGKAQRQCRCHRDPQRDCDKRGE